MNPNFVGLGDRQHGSQGVRQGPSIPSQGPLDRTAAGHKRKLDALRVPGEPRAKLPGPDTAPAVPSFGAFTLPSKPTVAASQPNHAPKPAQKDKPKPKSLGLIPQANGHTEMDVESASEDEDVDEEAQYAELGTKLTFEHDGEVMSLNNAADLAAWREERRKRWPTNTRVDQKEHERRMIGEERRRLIDGARALHKAPLRKHDAKLARSQKANARSDATDRQQGLREGDTPGRPVNASSQTSALDMPAVDQAVASVVEVDYHITKTSENSGILSEGRKALPGIDMADSDDELASGVEAPSTSSSESESSPSAESDDDGAPDEASSKPQTSAVPSKTQPLCRYFAASGYCRDGPACRFRHELSRKGEVAIARAQQHQHQQVKTPYDRFAPKLDPSATLERKSIHDRLVEQERIEEDRLALKAIKSLGDAGFFKASTSTNVEAP